jgi:hypothetical protein
MCNSSNYYWDFHNAEWTVIFSRTAIVLQLFVVTTCKYPINPITNPNPFFSHCDTWHYNLENSLALAQCVHLQFKTSAEVLMSRCSVQRHSSYSGRPGDRLFWLRFLAVPPSSSRILPQRRYGPCPPISFSYHHSPFTIILSFAYNSWGK